MAQSAEIVEKKMFILHCSSGAVRFILTDEKNALRLQVVRDCCGQFGPKHTQWTRADSAVNGRKKTQTKKWRRKWQSQTHTLHLLRFNCTYSSGECDGRHLLVEQLSRWQRRFFATKNLNFSVSWLCIFLCRHLLSRSHMPLSSLVVCVHKTRSTHLNAASGNECSRTLGIYFWFYVILSKFESSNDNERMKRRLVTSKGIEQQ